MKTSRLKIHALRPKHCQQGWTLCGCRATGMDIDDYGVFGERDAINTLEAEHPLWQLVIAYQEGGHTHQVLKFLCESCLYKMKKLLKKGG